MPAGDSPTLPVTVDLVGIELIKGQGRLVALAIVSLDFDGVPLILQGVRVMREGNGLVVKPPMVRHPTEGLFPAVVLPGEVEAAIGDKVLGVVDVEY